MFEFRPGTHIKWGKRCLSIFLVVFDSILLILADNENMHFRIAINPILFKLAYNEGIRSNFSLIWPMTVGLAALERLIFPIEL